ncbi:tRNA (guanosine(46)-N7)-methyltransferase TrmB [Cucumibacter marinus]|uniref:tRNA (guanosine(46)-N7)-methyltransferase TrmB n=1 Tax=Cucumibacter marinus TaxID=1121252 RepID=UPI000404ECEF|nr:tRNA (guanosine(46)-N7)-methyltransferase TrmB [Cucumibacter marinus]
MTDKRATRGFYDPDKPRAFFGRRAGHRLHEGQEALMRDLLPELAVSLDDAPLTGEALFGNDHAVWLEIGYGGGEHLARQAGLQPEVNFIGCEVFTGGIGKMLTAIRDQDLSNVRLHTEDALPLLLAMQPGMLSGAFLLYPDPWPKRRHHKRRFVSPQSLDALAAALKPGAEFRFATDIEDYADWTLAHILDHPDFTWAAPESGRWHEPFPGWKPTRYEMKARREGRNKSWYLTFSRK